MFCTPRLVSLVNTAVQQNTGISSSRPLHGVAITGSHPAITRTRCIWMQGDFHTWECCLFLSPSPLFLPLPSPSVSTVRGTSTTRVGELGCCDLQTILLFLCADIFSARPRANFKFTGKDTSARLQENTRRSRHNTSDRVDGRETLASSSRRTGGCVGAH